MLAFLSFYCNSPNSSREKLIWPLVRQTVEFTHPSPVASMESKLRIKRRIIRWINESSDSILILAYGLNDRKIIQALTKARQRGVQIRIILSPEKDYVALKNSNLTLEVRNGSGLQHLKAMLIDRQRMVSGTGNLTRSGLYYNNNAFLFLNFPRRHGEKIADRLLHPNERRPFLKIPGITMIFSPEGGELIQHVLARNIFRARSTVQFMMYRFTDPVLSALLYNRARNGVSVQGILDGSGNHPPGRAAPQEYYYDAGLIPFSLSLDGNENKYQASDGIYHGGHMHQKTAIIDRRVFTGSYNWSMSARNQNREILFILDSSAIVHRFRARFAELKLQSRPMPRPPRGSSHRTPKIRSGTICMDESNPVYSLHGKGPFFHALEWEKGSSSGDCLNSEKEAVVSYASAGPSRGKDYFIYNFNDYLIQGDGSTHTMSHSQAVHGPEKATRVSQSFCISRPCKNAPVNRIDLDDGWIRFSATFDDSKDEMQLFVLGRNRWYARSIQRKGPGFYRMDPLPEQDLLLFLNNGREFATCILYGAMDPEIQRYLQFFSFYGSTLNCIQAEGSS